MAKLEGFDRIIGMDLSKRTFKACVLTRDKNFEDRKIFSGSMTPEGRGHLLSQIGKKDVVAIEGGTSSNNFARELESVAGMVLLLNPGKQQHNIPVPEEDGFGRLRKDCEVHKGHP